MKRNWMVVAELLSESAAVDGWEYPPTRDFSDEKAYHYRLLKDAGYFDADGLLTMKGWDFHQLTLLPTFQEAHDLLINRFGGAPTDLLIDTVKRLHHESIERQRTQQARRAAQI